jgi:copper chaperone CopZ
MQENSSEITIAVRKQGFLWKQSSLLRNWKKYWCVLQSDHLDYYTLIGDEKPRGSIPLVKCQIYDASNKVSKKFCFELMIDKKVYLFAADNDLDMAEWMESILNVSLPMLSPSPSLSTMVELNKTIESIPTDMKTSSTSNPVSSPFSRPVRDEHLSTVLNVKGIMCEICEKQIRTLLTEMAMSFQLDMSAETVTIHEEKKNVDHAITKLEQCGFLVYPIK